MKKKKIAIIFFMLLITCIFTNVISNSVVGSNLETEKKDENVLTIKNNEEIDQQQTEYNDDFLIDHHDTIKKRKGVVQSFLPSIYATFITQVQLFIAKIGNVTADLTVGIRKVETENQWNTIVLYDSTTDLIDHLDEYVIIPSSKVNSSYSWIEFNFPQIKVDHSGHYVYQIIITGSDENTNTDNCYSIGYFNGTDQYKPGKMAEIKMGIQFGVPTSRLKYYFNIYPDHDLTFKLYAIKSEKPHGPDLIISELYQTPRCTRQGVIIPGQFHWVFTVKNIGDVALYPPNNKISVYEALTHKTDKSYYKGRYINFTNIKELAPYQTFTYKSDEHFVNGLPIGYILNLTVDPHNDIFEPGDGEKNNQKELVISPKLKVKNLAINNLLKPKSVTLSILLWERILRLKEMVHWKLFNLDCV